MQESIEIARPPEEIWEFVVDHANDPKWCRKVRAAKRSDAGTWKVWHKPVPFRPPVVLEIEHVRVEPPAHLQLREEDDASIFDVEYRLEVSATGTLFTQVSEFEWKKLPRPLQRVFARGVRRDIVNQLRDLTRLVEAG